MKLEHRVEKLEQVANPEENPAEEIRRAIREMKAGTYVAPPYVPGENALRDALHAYRLERGDTT